MQLRTGCSNESAGQVPKISEDGHRLRGFRGGKGLGHFRGGEDGSVDVRLGEFFPTAGQTGQGDDVDVDARELRLLMAEGFAQQPADAVSPHR